VPIANFVILKNHFNILASIIIMISFRVSIEDGSFQI